MQNNITYKGMSRVPSDGSSFQGELEESYNLVNSHGELRPIVPPDVIGKISGELLCVHKTAQYEHFITKIEDKIKAYRYEGGGLIYMDDIVFKLTDEEYIKITSIGNTLVLLTTKGVRYALWKNSAYIAIPSKLPFPSITFFLNKVEPERFSNHKKLFTNDEYKDDFKKVRGTAGRSPLPIDIANMRAGRSTTGSRVRGEVDPLVSPEFDNYVKGHINSRIEEYTEKDYFIFPFFVRYAIRMFDGSLVRHSPPFLMLPTKFIPFQAGIDEDTDTVYVTFQDIHELVMTHSGIDFTNYEDIIEGIDIFISDSIYTYDYSGDITGHKPNPFYVSTSTSTPDMLFGGIYKSNADILKEISTVGNFYKLASIPLSDLKVSATNKKVEIENLKAILQQEPMVDDFQTHDSIRAENSFVYNDKLHLSGIVRKKFEGFRYGYDTYFIHPDKASINVGKQPFIFYPGKAEYVTFEDSRHYNNNVEFAYKTFQLQNHQYLNGSFYLDPDLSNISFLGESYGPRLIVMGKPENIVDEGNKLYVSQLQNPFHFPVQSRVTLPVGKIIAMASNTRAISSGQFGQFPLFVFTDDGIWAMEVDSEGKYMIKQPVSREVCINPEVLPMDSHIAFVTIKGITILSASDTETITDIIADNNKRADRISINPAIQALSSQGLEDVYITDDIEVYLQQAKLGYEYIRGNGRIFAINENYPYAYVFDILSKTWSKTHSTYKNIINNYPDCYAHSENNDVVNLSTIGSSQDTIKVMLLTRPITLNGTLFNIRALVHRGVFNSALNTVLYASRDGIRYTPISSSRKNNIRCVGTPFRFYKYLVVADLKPNEVLSGVDIDLTQRYSNRLR